MSDPDPELVLLQMAERRAHERFTRLSSPTSIMYDADVIKAAKDIWTEAARAVLAYKPK